MVSSFLSKNEEKTNVTNLWYLESGASNHMISFKTKLTKQNKDITGHVRFGYGLSVKIEGKCSVVFICKNREERVFHEVYYIPSLRANISSQGQLSEEGNRVVLKGEFCGIVVGKNDFL